MKCVLLALIRCYRYAISPLLGRHCRFFPTCSQFALEAVAKYGAGKGAWLTLRRLLRCHPWNAGGVDPVP